MRHFWHSRTFFSHNINCVCILLRHSAIIQGEIIRAQIPVDTPTVASIDQNAVHPAFVLPSLLLLPPTHVTHRWIITLSVSLYAQTPTFGGKQQVCTHSLRVVKRHSGRQWKSLSRWGRWRQSGFTGRVNNSWKCKEHHRLMRSETVSEGGFFLFDFHTVNKDKSASSSTTATPPQTANVTPRASVISSQQGRHHKLFLYKSMTASMHSNPSRCQTATVLCLRYQQAQGSAGRWHNWIDIAGLTLIFRLWPCSSYKANLLQAKWPHRSVNHP